MRLRDHLNHQVLSKPMQGASNRDIKALHDLKAWLHYGWVEKASRRLHASKYSKPYNKKP